MIIIELAFLLAMLLGPFAMIMFLVVVWVYLAKIKDLLSDIKNKK